MTRNNLDPLRALAAGAVLCCHIKAYTGFSLPWISELGGLLGVELFFAISGYLIIQSAANSPGPGFLIKRAFRIFPSYWVALLGCAALLAPCSDWAWPADWSYYLINFFALTHLSPNALVRHDVLTVSWTLTIEWFWYLLAPLIIIASRRAGSPRLFWPAVGIASLLGSSAWVLAAQASWLDPLYASAIRAAGVAPVNAFMRFAYIVNAAPAQLVFFVMGALVWRYQQSLNRIPSALLVLLLVVGAGGAVFWNSWTPLNPSFVPGIGMSALLILALRLPTIRWHWPHRLGEWTYPIYLLHVPIILFVFNRVGLKGWGALASALILLLLTAALLHYLVEAPMNRLGHRLASRIPQPTPASN